MTGTPRSVAIVWAALLAAIGTVAASSRAGPVTNPPATTAHAGTETDKAAAETRLRDLRRQLDALAAQQRELAGERGDASKALRSADANVGRATRSLRDTRAAIAAQQARLAQLENQQASLRDKLAGQRAALAALLRSAYALGDSEQLKLLLAQDRVVDLSRALAYHRYIEADRLRRIDALGAQLRALAEVSRQVDAQRDSLAAAQHEQAARLADVQAQRDQRGRIVAQLQARYHDSAAHMSALGRDAGALESLIRKLSAVMPRTPQPATGGARHGAAAPAPGAPFHGAGGQLPWPIDGPLLGGFGDGSSGLLIGGAAGEEVHAIADGRVAFADWLKGYGLIVIVDHGNGLMSLYANNDALLKNAGDSVRAGEAVSTVGSSGGQGRNALYFEIRVDGKAVDPRTWLRKR